MNGEKLMNYFIRLILAATITLAIVLFSLILTTIVILLLKEVANDPIRVIQAFVIVIIYVSVYWVIWGFKNE